MRKRHFRAVVFRLECGHESAEGTGLYRVPPERRAGIVSHHVRNGIWCSICNAHCQPVECLGTRRLG